MGGIGHFTTVRREGHPHLADFTDRSETPVTCLSIELIDRPSLEKLNLRQLAPLTPRKALTLVTFLTDVTKHLDRSHLKGERSISAHSFGVFSPLWWRRQSRVHSVECEASLLMSHSSQEAGTTSPPIGLC